MNFTYGFLQANEVEVEILKDLNMGDDSLEQLLDQTNGLIPEQFAINEDEEAIILAGTKAKFYVQPYNGWYEIAIKAEGVEIKYDVAIEEEGLSQYFKLIRVVGPNKHFVKEA